MEDIQRLTERAKAIPGNLWEIIGGAAAPLMIGLGAVICVTAICLAAIRLRPRRRIGYAMIPDPNFDPSLEEIIRWSAGLAEARAAIGFGTNSHRMIRLTFCSDSQGNLVSLIGINPRARSVAERNGYSRVDLADPNEVLGELAPAWLPPTTACAVDEPAPVLPPAEPHTPQDTTAPPPRPPATAGSGGEARRWDSAL